MAAHARLKNDFTEDEKYHNLMRWLFCSFTEFPVFTIANSANSDHSWASDLGLCCLPWSLWTLQGWKFLKLSLVLHHQMCQMLWWIWWLFNIAKFKTFTRTAAWDTRNYERTSGFFEPCIGHEWVTYEQFFARLKVLIVGTFSGT